LAVDSQQCLFDCPLPTAYSIDKNNFIAYKVRGFHRELGIDINIASNDAGLISNRKFYILANPAVGGNLSVFILPRHAMHGLRSYKIYYRIKFFQQ